MKRISLEKNINIKASFILDWQQYQNEMDGIGVITVSEQENFIFWQMEYKN